MEISIRSAQVADAEAIARIRVTAWQYAYRGIVPQDYLDKLDPVKEIPRWREGLSNPVPGRSFWVTEVEPTPGEERTVAGYCVCGPNRDPDPEYPAELYAIYVHPQYHRHGIGQLLVKSAAASLVQCGYSRAVIFVLAENAPARRFYKALGGKAVREKVIEVAGVSLQEIGYGYELSGLL